MNDEKIITKVTVVPHAGKVIQPRIVIQQPGEHTPNEFGGRSHHRQVEIRHGGRRALIDIGIADLILELWRADIDTVMSCQRHGPTGKVWIAFTTAEDAETFLDVVVYGSRRSKWSRAEQWYFGQYEPVSKPLSFPDSQMHPADWEFHCSVVDVRPPDDVAGFTICINVLFPGRDLAKVLKRLRAYNA